MVLFRRYMLRVAITIAIVNQVEETRASHGAREHAWRPIVSTMYLFNGGLQTTYSAHNRS